MHRKLGCLGPAQPAYDILMAEMGQCGAARDGRIKQGAGQVEADFGRLLSRRVLEGRGRGGREVGKGTNLPPCARLISSLALAARTAGWPGFLLPGFLVLC